MKLNWISFFLGLALLSGLSWAQAQESFPNYNLADAPEKVSIQQTSYDNIAAAATTDGSCNSGTCTTECPGDWRNNLQAWVGASSFKSLGDNLSPNPPFFGTANSAGFVSGLNTSFALGDRDIRGQIGGSYGIYDLKGRNFNSQSSSEQQTFITAGFFKRSDIINCDRISWGLVYDQMFDHQYGTFAGEVYLGQVRGVFGYAWNECNEFGVWGTMHTNQDGSYLLAPPRVAVVAQPIIRAANQANTYWKHNYAFGGTTTAYVGFYDKADIGSWSTGVSGTAPLSDNLALYGNFAYQFPGVKTGTFGAGADAWTVNMGLVYYFGGKAVSPSVSGRAGTPLLNVADNGTFQITN